MVIVYKKKQLNKEVVDALGDRKWRLVANLPYQIASPLIVNLLSSHPNCLGQFVTIQYEVAQRLLAKVDSENWGVLSILVQRLADVSLITKASNTCFWPKPKITSACVGIVPTTFKSLPNNKEFALFVTALFAKRRKQLGSIIGRDRELPEGIQADARPSTLTIEQLEMLFQVVKTLKV